MVEVVGELDTIRRMAARLVPAPAPLRPPGLCRRSSVRDLSPDPDNAYFADASPGKSSRTCGRWRGSCYLAHLGDAYRGTSKSMPEMPPELEVRHVLEGSVARPAASYASRRSSSTRPAMPTLAKRSTGPPTTCSNSGEMSRRMVEGTRGRSGRRRRVAHRCGPRRTGACTKPGCGRCTRGGHSSRRASSGDSGSRRKPWRASASAAVPCGVRLPEHWPTTWASRSDASTLDAAQGAQRAGDCAASRALPGAPRDGTGAL